MTGGPPPDRKRLIPAGLDATLVLLRHGESVYVAEGRFQGRADTPLSARGARQAELAAARLADPGRAPVLPIPTRPPVEIVHSPLARTTMTARLVASAIADTSTTGGDRDPSPIRAEAGFVEIAQGAWEGMTRSEVETLHGELLAAWRRTPLLANAPGGERIAEVAERVAPALGAVLDRLAAEPRVVRSATTAAGFPPAAAPDTPWTLIVGHDGVFKVALLTLLGLPLERFWAFPFAMCGISIVEIRDGSAALRAHNLTDHLAPLLDGLAVAETEERQRSGAL